MLNALFLIKFDVPIKIDPCYMEFNIASGNKTLGGFGLMHGMLHSILMDTELKKGISAESRILPVLCRAAAQDELVDGWLRISRSGGPRTISRQPSLLLSRALVGLA